MNILVIHADCIRINSSANLCHIAYIQGLVEAGHNVELINAAPGLNTVDPSIVVPQQVKLHEFSATSFYESLSLRKNAGLSSSPSSSGAANKNTPVSFKQKAIRKVKDFILSLYGPYGINKAFVNKARNFSSDLTYDFVISLSSPSASHLLAKLLIERKKVKTKEWIQVWEDPWYTCFHGLGRNKKIYREESKLLKSCKKICYVSPLTLKEQKKAFPDLADRMYWQPLPHYYKNDCAERITTNTNMYGYFGDYDPETRNLKPFYLAAKQEGVTVNICGNPSTLFESTEHIHIHPRLTLDRLRPLEDQTNVLVFLCNRIGGQIPGKIYQYSATNKHILFILDGTEEEKRVLTNFFKPFDRYVFCENNVESISSAIRQIEHNELPDVHVRPLDEFNPKTIINNILEGTSLFDE